MPATLDRRIIVRRLALHWWLRILSLRRVNADQV